MVTPAFVAVVFAVAVMQSTQGEHSDSSYGDSEQKALLLVWGVSSMAVTAAARRGCLGTGGLF
jgi:hypothetical protein